MKARDRYLARYAERERAFPVATETRTIVTGSGDTYLRICGPQDGPPLVLLPSASATSLFWSPNMESLSAVFRVYALDNIYDFGRSVYKRPMKTPDDLTDWLEEVLEALGLREGVGMMGLSYGAWLTARYAIRFPRRLRGVVLIAPPATIRELPGAWAWYGLSALIPHRHFMMNLTRWMFPVLTRRTDEASVRLVNDLVDDAFLGLGCFKLKMLVAPTVLSDEEIRKLSEVPTLFMVGEHEVVYPAQEAVRRLGEVAPGIRAAVIPGAGHDLTFVQADMVDRMAIDFLVAVEPSSILVVDESSGKSERIKIPV